MKKELYSTFRSAKLIELIKVEVNEGEGNKEDPIRRVAYLLTMDGEVLAKIGDNKERLFAGTDEMFNYD